MTAVEVFNGSAELASVDIGTVVQVFGGLAGQVSQTDFVPRAFKGKPEAILACMLYGRELGLGPMQSLKLIDSIQGTPTLKPEAMRALVRKAGHRIWTEENTDQRVTVYGWRREDPAEIVERVSWSMDDARRAGLVGKDSWKHYPRAMLLARATAELCRQHFADVIGGLSYIPEEAEDFGPAAPIPPPPAPSAPAGQVVDAETGAIQAPVSTRRPPPVKPGFVSSAAAKKQLLTAIRERNSVLTEEQAKQIASEMWGTRGTAQITEGHLAELIGSLDTEPEPEPEPMSGAEEAGELADAELPF